MTTSGNQQLGMSGKSESIKIKAILYWLVLCVNLTQAGVINEKELRLEVPP